MSFPEKTINRSEGKSLQRLQIGGIKTQQGGNASDTVTQETT